MFLKILILWIQFFYSSIKGFGFHNQRLHLCYFKGYEFVFQKNQEKGNVVLEINVSKGFLNTNQRLHLSYFKGYEFVFQKNQEEGNVALEINVFKAFDTLNSIFLLKY